MLRFSREWFLTGVDVSVKSLLLVAVAYLLLRLFKVRSATIRHRVWVGVMCGMLALPVLAQILPSLPLPLSLYDYWHGTSGADELHVARVSNPASEQIPVTGVAGPHAEQSPDTAQFAASQQQPTSAAAIASAPDTLAPSGDRNIAGKDALAAQGTDATTPTAAFALTPRILNSVMTVVVVIWLAGTLVMLTRLISGLVATRRIVHRADDVDPAEFQSLQSPVAQILSSAEIRVPVTVGVWRPCILLPQDWPLWSRQKREAVLIHEAAHVERRDFLFSVLAELNRCLYWFHPLSWWLRTRISDLAEEACDDAAIVATGDPAGYARHLLDVASVLSRGEGRVCQPGLSMARMPNVEGRIHTILDATRPLSKQLRWKATTMIVALAIPIVAAVAALSLAGADTKAAEAQPVTPVATEANGGDDVSTAETVASLAGPSAANRELTFSGTVMDPDGKPVANARLFLHRWDLPVVNGVEEPIVVSGADGTFRFRLQQKDCPEYTGFLILKDGFGFAYKPAYACEDDGTLLAAMPVQTQRVIREMLGELDSTFRLRPDDVPLRGRVLNTKGQPVSPAEITITKVWDGKDGSLEAWEEATTAERADFYSVRSQTTGSLNGPKTAAIAHIVHEDDGWFTIHGIGRERIAKIAVRAPGVAGFHVFARTRSGETIKLPNSWDDPEMKTEVYYPAEFTHVAGPTQTVVGRITDRETGKPIANCQLVTQKTSASDLHSMADSGFIRATTDADGRYRLEGLPIGKAKFVVLPTTQSRYVRSEAGVTIKVSREAVQKDIKLQRGVLVTGNAVDSATGEQLTGRIEYFAFGDHPMLNGPDRIRLADVDMQFDRTNPDGRFEMVVLPGRGMIGFMADNAQDFPRGAGAENIEAPEGPFDGSMRSFHTQPSYCLATNFNFLADFNASPDAPPVLELKLESGMNFDVKVVDPDGTPVRNTINAGERRTGGWYKSFGGGFRVSGHREEIPRRLFAYLPDTDQCGTLLIDGKPEEDPTIRLQQAGRVVGRLVNKHGEPMAGVAIRNGHRFHWGPGPDDSVRDNGSFPDDQDARRDRLITDDDGQFEILGLLPGLRYTARGDGPRSMSEDKTIRGTGLVRLGDLFRDLTIQAGEVKDLGDVQLQRTPHIHPHSKTSSTSSTE